MVSFRKWMEKYEEEYSSLGDLARYIAADDTFPKSSKADVIFNHMDTRNVSSDYIMAFYRAWGMYERERVIEKLLRKLRNDHE